MSGGAIAAVVGFGLWVRVGPLPDRVLRPASVQLTTFVDRHGRPLDAAAARAVSARTQGRSSTRGPSLARRADRLAAATLAAEDQRFRSHAGVDPVALGRAVFADVRARGVVQGGSTITQQLIKLRLGRRGNSLGSKARESLYALRLEHRMSKDEILSAYLAEAPYGGRVVGAEAASLTYFTTPVSQLTWAESAFLAALPQRPSAFNPRRDPAAALGRQRWILRRLRGAGAITAAELRVALAETLHFSARVDDALAPHLTAMLSADPALLRPAGVENGKQKGKGTRSGAGATVSAARGTASAVRTTIDADLQRDVAGIARHHRGLLARSGAANVSVVILDNATGAVRAWEGSGDFFDWTHGGMINGPLQKRQTGSTIKPFIYGMAFDDGEAPGDLINDAPFDRTYNGGGFHPQNYDKKYRGIITLRSALAGSVNVAAVKLLDEREPADLIALLNRAGVELDFPASHYGLSLALGTGEIDLLDLTRAYASLARGGRSVRPAFVEPAPVQAGGSEVVSSATAFLIGDVLSDNEARAPAFGRSSALRFPFPVAAKTGTSQDFHDNWVVGYTKEFTVGVWVGNFDRRPLRGATGVTGAGPIFHAVMLAAHRRLTPVSGLASDATLFAGPLPGGLEAVPVCSGAAASGCDASRSDFVRVEYRWAGRSGAAADTKSADGASGSAAPAGGHATPGGQATPGGGSSASGGAIAATSLPSTANGGSLPLQMTEPKPRANYLLDPTAPRSTQVLPLNASGGRPPYRFVVDGAVLGGREWPVIAGNHQACALDAVGGRVCAEFRVT